MQGRFPRVCERTIHIRPPVDGKLAKPPVRMKRSSIEAQVFSKRIKRFAAGEQEPDRTNIAIVCATTSHLKSIHPPTL